MHSGTISTTFLVRVADNELMRAKGFQCRLPGDKNARVYRSTAIASLENAERPDLVVIGVKSYSLTEVLDKLEAAFGKDIPVMSVLNGVRHVEEISRKFDNAIFATIAFNAFRISEISAEAVGGSIALSTTSADKTTMNEVHEILKRKISVTMADNPYDAAHCKLVMNLGNALLSMVGFHNHRNRELDVLQKITATVLWEGVQVIRKNGTKEVRISGMPTWPLIWMSKKLPTFIVLPIFEKKMQASSINSMAQDLQKGSDHTEVEDINGYLVQLADKLGVEIPYNRALYELFKQWVRSGAQPIKPSVLLSHINSFSKR